MTFFPGFEQRRVQASATEINLVIGGKGPPLLLLHGYPQTHVLWRHVAPRLADRFTVVATDLRGYGDSGKPAGGGDHAAYAKRTMAADQVEVMQALGFARFFLCGHDRGARVAHRLALDHLDRVTRPALLDIAPTLTMFEHVNQGTATRSYHWYFLIQPGGLPETLIGARPEFYLRHTLGSWTKVAGAHEPAAFAEYLRCFQDPATIHASCEDYRAAASIDLVHDRADVGARIACPLLVLWGGASNQGSSFDLLSVWRERARDVRGFGLSCGHFLPEEAPAETARALGTFFAATD
ncbi:MAG: alpha/beta hydrolase [Alphaproteobacteria bacterium]|nr:alpha/beta hydrolase [Alphaproteobacteria bacterium]